MKTVTCPQCHNTAELKDTLYPNYKKLKCLGGWYKIDRMIGKKMVEFTKWCKYQETVKL